MEQLQVHLLGTFYARQKNGPVVKFSSQKEQELLGYLLVKRGRVCPRDHLAKLLWPGGEVRNPKKSLRNTLWHLKSKIEKNSHSENTTVLTTNIEWIRLEHGPSVWSDVDTIEKAFSVVRNRSTEEQSEADSDLINDAIRQYNGEFLEGSCSEWSLFERERLRQIFFRLIDRMMAYSRVKAQYDMGVELGLRLLSLEPARERTHRLMMRLYDSAGDRMSSLRQYEQCSHALRENLGVEPASKTTQLYKQLCANTVNDVDMRGTIDVVQGDLTRQKVLDCLVEIRNLLERIERQFGYQNAPLSHYGAKRPSTK